MTAKTLEAALLDGVFSHDVALVGRCLEGGADPDGGTVVGKESTQSALQPDSPLKAVIFCISDALLDERGLEDFRQITELLLANGADPGPARAMARQRYGDIDAENPADTFTAILALVAHAAEKSRP